MATKKKTDTYVNRAIVEMTESAAGTTTYEQVNFGVGLFQGVALLIQRIDYHPKHATLRELVAATDGLVMAVTTSNQLNNIYDDDPAIIDTTSLISIAATTDPLIETPIVRDFSTLPGGGFLLPANPVYVALYSTNFAAPAAMRCRIYFTFIELNDADYLELIQSRIPVNL